MAKFAPGCRISPKGVLGKNTHAPAASLVTFSAGLHPSLPAKGPREAEKKTEGGEKCVAHAARRMLSSENERERESNPRSERESRK